MSHVSPVWKDIFKDEKKEISLQTSTNRWTFAVDIDVDNTKLKH